MSGPRTPGVQGRSAPVDVDVRLLSLPTVESLAAGHERSPQERRELVVIGLTDDEGLTGWGECSALNRPTYTSEWARGAFVALSQAILSSAGRAGAALGPEHPMATAGLEMALTDLRLRAEGQSLASSLGVTRTAVPAGAAVGLAALEDLSKRVADLVDAGFGRIKLKIAPGNDVQPVRALRAQHPDLEIQVDANGSYRAGDLAVLLQLASFDIRALEQPFPAGDFDHETVQATRSLIQADITVVADEGVNDLDDARRLHALGMLSAISLKPARVGGLRAARELHDWAVQEDVALTAGGMLESGLGRHSLAAFAALEGFTITGDVSPARRWLADDPWPDLQFEPAPPPGRIKIPHGAGVAPPPDLEVLDCYTVERSAGRVDIDSLHEPTDGSGSHFG